jgi:two-component system, NarL family, response regulator
MTSSSMTIPPFPLDRAVLPMEGPVQQCLLIVDRRPVVRSGLAQIAAGASESVRAVAMSDLEGAAAEAHFMGAAPRAIVLGFCPGDDPAEMVHVARALAPAVICIVDRGEPALLRSASSAGADAYLMLDEVAPESIRDALVALDAGVKVIPAALRVDRARAARSPALTARCREVLEALAAGLRDDEIANRLGITIRSVRKHIAVAQERLEARTRVHALAIAAREGLI